MAKSGNTLGKLVCMPVISSHVSDANPAVTAETAQEKENIEQVQGEAGASFSEIKTVLESAQTPYKGSTVIGHALSKHAGRHPEIWGTVKGSMKTWNEQATKHLKGIVRAPGEFKQVTTDKGISFLEKRLSDGRGARLNMDGTFKGFVD